MTTARDLLHALPTDFRRRMESWARWRITGAARRGSVGVSGIYSHSPGGNSYGTQVPIMSGEAKDTDAALWTLPRELREAVETFWMFEGDSFAQCARRVRVDYRTFVKRLDVGHEQLRTELRRRHTDAAAAVSASPAA